MANSKTSTSKKKSSAKSVKTAAKPKKAPRSVQMAPPPEPPQPIRRELTGLLMKQSDIILATGGPSMVNAAYSSGTPALGVGAGAV